MKPLILLIALLCGCAPLIVGVATYSAVNKALGCDAPLTEPEPAWPRLEIIWRIVPAETVRQNCDPGQRACAHALLDLGQAWVYITPEDYADAACREHERGHAEGRSHKYGDSGWARQVMDHYRRTR